MLGKNTKIPYYDAHFHFFYCKKAGILPENQQIYGCSCAHSVEEWESQKILINPNIKAFGLHPQSAGQIYVKENADFLESLLKKERVLIGEMGFDYFSEQYKNHKAEQEEMFNIQLELAEQYKVPVIIHCRKANEKLFEYSKRLKNLPGVLFHSFMGTYSEVDSLLKKDINGYFSFGKQLLNNNKKVIECTKNLPLEKLLMETDAPYQFLKNEEYTKPEEIKKVYEAAFALRKDIEYEDFCFQMELNYKNLFL